MKNEKEFEEWTKEDISRAKKKVNVEKNDTIVFHPEPPSLVSIGELTIQSCESPIEDLCRVAKDLASDPKILKYLEGQRTKLPRMIA